MLRRGRSIRIYVRNKARYNPESKERDFLYVEVADFAGTTIGEIKEDVRRQCRNSLRIDALYLNNEPLANDRSVAHYNLEDETILETTSNPFWVSCLYIKASEIKQLMAGHPEDNDIQKWTEKSLPKKYTLIGLLLNSKSEYRGQPPHFSTLDDFVSYLENLKKKGATMHPNYTQKDMRALQREYRTDFMDRYADPLAAFLDHYAVKLGYLDPDDIVQNRGPRQNPAFGGAGAVVRGQMGVGAAQNKAPGRRKEARLCEDCEGSVAEVYCIDCQTGLALCRPCSATLHAGATRRRHTLQDIAQAPKTAKPYVPRAFLAPFSIIVAMYSAMRKGQLSLTENEIKKSAQSLTDTDLQDKQHGKYVGGFDCMENVLMLKGFVQKEAARVPTYALTASGQALGEKLFTFYTEFYKFSTSCRLPKLTINFQSSVIGNRQLCLLIDENERDKDRLLRYATEKQISAQVRLLPAGDYIWILTPPMVDPHMVYTGRDYGNEQVLPFVVERKSWEDLENSTHSARFQRQVNSMLGSGLKNCYYLVEGSVSGTRYNPTHQQQHQLKAQVEKLTSEYGFYVNYTTSWMKSAQWLLWFTGLVMEKLNMGGVHGVEMSYTEYMSRVARHQGAAVVQASFKAAQKLTHQWTAQLFIDHIFRDSLKERSMLSTIQEDLGTRDRNKHLLIIDNLLEYNKRRQSTLNKCCDLVYANPGQAREIVSDKIGAVLHNMVHYDIPSYWQLYIQVLLGVYVVRTECEQDKERIKQKFLDGPQNPPPPSTNKTPGRSRQPRKKATKGPAVELQPETDQPLPQYRPAHTAMDIPDIANKSPDKSDQFRRKAVIHTIDSFKETSPGREIEHSDRETHDRLTRVKTGRKGEPSPGRTKRQVIVPFAGRGVCLGNREPVNPGDHELLDNIRDRDRLEAMNGVGLVGGVRDRLMTPPAYGMRDRERHQAAHGVGLIGGMRDRGNDAGIVDVREDFTDDTRRTQTDDMPDAVPLDPADFIDSQNEDDILNEVLNRSARDVHKPSREDELMQLALKLSTTETSVGNRETQSEEELLRQAIEQSQREVAKRQNLEQDQLEIQNDQTLNYNSSRTGTGEMMDQGGCCLKFDPNNEDEMVKLAIEMSRKECTPVKIEHNIRKESRDVHEWEQDQLKQALDRRVNDITYTETSGSVNIMSGTADEQMPKRAVKRKLDREENNNVSNSGVEVKTEVVDNLIDEDNELKKAIELSKQSVEVKDSNEDDEIRCAIANSMVEHSPMKKSKPSYDEELRLALARSIVEQNTPTKALQSVIVLDKIPGDVCDSSPEKKAKVSVRGAKKTIELDGTEHVNQALLKNMTTNLYTAGSENEEQIDLSSQSGHSGCCNFPKSGGVNSLCDDDDDDDSVCHREATTSCANESQRRNPHHSPKNSVTSSLTGNAKETFSRDKLGVYKIKSENSDCAKVIQKQDESDSGDDLVPPSPEKCSQSVPNRSIGGKSMQSRTATCKQGEKANIENQKPASLGKVKLKNGKKSGFDIKSSLFATSDNSDSDEDSGSEENMFEDLQDGRNDKETIVNGKLNLEKEKNVNSEKSDSDDNSESEENIFEDQLDGRNNVDGEINKDIAQEKQREKSDYTRIEGFSDAGYDVDDDLDIDYQPSTQEIQEATEDSDDVGDVSDGVSDKHDDSDGNDSMSDVYDDVLPVIREPRGKRYKELKTRCEHLMKQKISKQGLQNVEQEIEENNLEESDSVEGSAGYDRDSTLASMLQECFDRENKQEAEKRALIDDAYIAKRLQEEYDRKAKTKVPEEQAIDDAGRDVDDISDEEYARKLQAELNKDVVDIEHKPEHYGENVQHHEISDTLGTFEEGSKELVRELQRRELQKIENLKKAMDRDRNLADQLNSLEKDATGGSTTDTSNSITGQANMQTFAAGQKSGRSQTIAQLNAYRRQQMEKYSASHGTPVAVIDLDKEDTDSIDLTGTDRDIITHTTPNQNRITGPVVANSQTDQLHSSLDGHMTQPDHSQYPGSGHMTQPDHSQYTVSGHMTESSQSVKSDVTCGNCGEKGHTRKFKHCPRYHSAEETTRREEKAREDKKRRELRAVQEQLKQQINAEKDERKKQEIQNMQDVVMSAETEFQTTMTRLRNIIGQVEHLSEPDQHNNRQRNSRKRKKNT